MKKIIGILVFLISITSLYPVAGQNETKGYWRLVATNFNAAESVNDDNVKANTTITAHSYEINPGGGNMSTTTAWLGNESTIKATFSFNIPETLVSGESYTVSINVADSGSDNQDAHISHSAGAGLWVRYGDNWSLWGRASAFTQDYQLRENPPPSAMRAETVESFTAPEKADGFVAKFTILAGGAPGPMVINYDYEYVEGAPDKPVSSSSVSNAPTTTTNKQITPTPSKDPNKNSGCIFSDLIGQVEVLIFNPEDPDDDENWQFAKIDMDLPPGTKIRTGIDSSAILSFSDMSTFVLKPNTTVILTDPVKKQSKIALAAGNIWANIKKMAIDGTMDIEMSQAVAGIKGTTFVLEESDGKSIVKVLEGTVAFTEKKSGKSVNVSSGNMAAADSSGNIQLNNLDIKVEAEKWNKTIIELQLNNKFMKVNGVQKEIDPGRNTVPTIKKNRTLIPIRAVLEALGGTVAYEPKERKIILKINDKTLETWVDKTDIKLNNISKQMDVAPTVINGRTMVPVRFVAENFGFEVQWKEIEKRIIIQ